MKYSRLAFFKKISILDILVLIYIFYSYYIIKQSSLELTGTFDSQYDSGNYFFRFIQALLFIYVFTRYSLVSKISVFKSKSYKNAFKNTLRINYKGTLLIRFVIFELIILVLNFSYVSDWFQVFSNIVLFFIYLNILYYCITKLSFIFKISHILIAFVMINFIFLVLSIPMLTFSHISIFYQIFTEGYALVILYGVVMIVSVNLLYRSKL